MGQFYSNQHTDTAVDAAARRERNARIVDMLASHSPLEVAEIVGVSQSTVSQVARKAGLPPRWGNGKGNGKRKPPEPGTKPKANGPKLEPSHVVGEYLLRKRPRPAPVHLPPARAVGFAGYPGVYCRCAACFFSGWAKIGAESVCPRCKLPLQIVYTPRIGE